MEANQPNFNQLKKENELLKKLATRLGFFRYYFEQLPYHPTKKACFIAVNDTYFNLFQEYRYETYDSFRQQLNNNLKNI
jgi:hypothetical protein